eukprot:3455780-Rhodomonas_salina.1
MDSEYVEQFQQVEAAMVLAKVGISDRRKSLQERKGRESGRRGRDSGRKGCNTGKRGEST